MEQGVTELAPGLNAPASSTGAAALSFRLRQVDLVAPALLTLAAFALFVWRLDARGLGYDEAASALMARATPLEIVDFHWRAGFEHPPFWQLTLYIWTKLYGQNEWALRALAAMAATLVIPLSWQFLRALYVGLPTLRLLATAMIAASPILLLYGQEARMYSLVLVLALSSLYLCARIVRRPSLPAVGLFVLLNWAMTGYHYYSALLIVAEGIYLASAAVSGRRKLWQWAIPALLLSVVPLLLWVTFSPGFRQTADSILASVGSGGDTWRDFLERAWRDITFGSIRWQPQWAAVSFVLLPIFLLGMVDGLWLRPRGASAVQRGMLALSGLLLTLVALGPPLFSAAIFGSLVTRYILYVLPAVYALIALGVLRLWEWHYLLGAAALAAVAVVAIASGAHYQTSFHKIGYREMVEFLDGQMADSDAILLEAPRQHLLTKYYIGDEPAIYPVPSVELPAYWPITAPPVVPEEVDDEVQAYLQDHPSLWLSLTAENEVDPGEFLARYLTAVAYRGECLEWQAVNLCHYISPAHIEPELTLSLDRLFGDELHVGDVGLALFPGPAYAQPTLLVQLDWRALAEPTLDYKVSLKLFDAEQKVVEQSDSYPIGPLLPPTTWRAGDEKRGYISVPLAGLSADSVYSLGLSVYDSNTMESVAAVDVAGEKRADSLPLATIYAGDWENPKTVEIRPMDE